MKINHWNLPHSKDYKQFFKKKIYTIPFKKEHNLRYCVIPGKNKKQTIPIILIQGMGLTIENWCLDFLKTLDDFTLYLIDPVKVNDLKICAESIYEITKHLSKFYFVGYSFGSFVIQEYMSVFSIIPVQKVVFLAGGCVCSFKLYIKPKNFTNMDQYDKKLILNQTISSMKARISQKNCFFHDSYPNNIPFLFIRAEKDHIFKEDYLFTGKNEIIVKNTDHNFLISRPIYIAKKVKEFFV